MCHLSPLFPYWFSVWMIWIVVLLASGVCPLVGEVGPGACAGFLVGGTGACLLVGGAGSCPSGGQGRVKGCVYRRLWGQDDLRQPVCWWVGLCSHPVGCLDWGVLALEPAGCWWGQVSVPKWRPPGELTLMSVPWSVYHQCPWLHSEPQLTLSPQETLHNPQVGLAQAPMESLLCPGSQCPWNHGCTLEE